MECYCIKEHHIELLFWEQREDTGGWNICSLNLSLSGKVELVFWIVTE